MMKLKQPKSPLTKQQPDIPSGASDATNSEPCTTTAETLETSVDSTTPGGPLTNESLQKAILPEPLATKLGISPVYAPWSEPLVDVILALGVNLEPFSAFAEFVAETKSKYTGFDIAGNPKPYVPLSELKKYWTVHRISKVLYAFSERLDLSADLIKRAYLGIFSTLVYTHHDDLQLLARLFFRLNLDDDRLPLRRRPSEWPDEPLHRDFFSRFAENQWLFFPLPFDADKLYDRDIDDRCILPITFGDQIAHGSAVSIYRFDIHPEYNRIGLDKAKRLVSQTFVFKIYHNKKYEDFYTNERRALQRLSASASPNLVKFHGSFRQLGSYCLILEYAEDAAVLGLPSEVSGGMDTDHRRLSKFSSVEDPNYQRVRNCLHTDVKNIRSQVKAEPEAASGPTEMIQTPGTFNLRRNRHFTGRQEILEALHETLDRQYPEPKKTPPYLVVLHGVGGVGKTEIAREYIHQLKTPYLVYYIMCRNSRSITESYRHYVGQDSGTDAEIIVSKFARHVRGLEKPWLIVFDNVEDLDAFQKLGPEALRLGEGSGSFLLTTKCDPSRLPISKTLSTRFKALQVEPMDNDEAKKLVLHLLGTGDHDPSKVSAFIDGAGGLPLVLAAAKTVLVDGIPSINTGGRLEQMLSDLPSSLAYEYISCLACLDADEIPAVFLAEYQSQASLTMAAKEAQHMLLRSHLIQYVVTGQIRIHPLVQAVVRKQLRAQGRLESVAGLVMGTVANIYFAATDNGSKPHINEDPYGRHVKALIDLESESPFSSIETRLAKARLFHARGAFLLWSNMPAHAAEDLRKSLDIYDTAPGSRHQQLALVSRLATACRAQGLYAEAEKLEARFQQAEIRSSRHWKQAPSTTQSDHIENEVDGQQADEVEIESVLSNLPSLTAGSTISSALTLALIEDIKADVLTILTKDEELHELLQETPKRITHDKFQRNFLRLFRAFVTDIRKEPESEEQELRQVIRVLRYQSRNIASHICQHIFDLKEQSEALLSLAQQTPDKGGQLTNFFGNDSTPEIVGVPKDEPLDDGESSGSELEEPETVRSHHVPLGDLEIIILESKSFLRFREQYRAFLFPRSDPQPLEEVIPTDDTDPRAGRRDSGASPRPTSELLESPSESTARPSVLEEGFAFVRTQIQRWMRVPVKDGYMRIDWRCDCGDELYADFSESDADSIRHLEACLKGHTVDAGGGTATSQTSHPPGRVPALTAATGSSPLQPLSNIQPNNTGQPSSSQNQSPVPIGGATQANVLGSQASKRFIELCVNTGEFQRQLAEIDISTVASDAQLFDRIRERYREVRSFRTRYFLLKPVDVHFVQFSVEDRHRVGILDKPMAIPSVAEMAAEGYAYYPCPLRPPPIPANIFLHHLSKPGKHPRLLWGNRIPQKLHNSILQVQTPNDLVTGWGVHIIEGLNKASVLVCSLVGLLISGIVAVVWAVVKDDVQGGFGIGAWLTSVQAVVVMLAVTKWLET